jgi:hypothetical protein
MLPSLSQTVLISLGLALTAAAQSTPSGPTPTPTTQVLAMLRVGEGANLGQIRQTMPAEIRATVRLYLDGRIAQWYSRSDGRGVVFLLNCQSVEEAKTLLGQLPLVKEHGATFEYVALSPLRPLQLLLTPAPKQ